MWKFVHDVLAVKSTRSTLQQFDGTGICLSGGGFMISIRPSTLSYKPGRGAQFGSIS